jgi:hypothetical protein
VAGDLGFQVHAHPNLIAVAALIKHHIHEPKGDCTEQQKAENAHALPRRVGVIIKRS